MIIKRYDIDNYTDSDMYDEMNGVKGQILAIIRYENQRFLVYRILHNKEVFIERIKGQKTDLIHLLDQIEWIEDETLWRRLMSICHKEGIL